MKKKLFIAAIAITALASCTSNDFVGDQDLQNGSSGTSGAISFNMSTAAVTRAEGSTAAKALDNQFIVWGEKNESGGTAVTVPSTNIVFPNYQVNWVDHRHSTTSNSSGWEYVGYTHSNTANTDDYQTNITPHLYVAQEIKYWDMSASNYVFTAVSALKDDIKTGKIKINKTLNGSDEYAKGYTITATESADFTKLYIADRNKIEPGYGTTPVTMTFRNILSHIRVGIYETIPGYEVSGIKFYQSDGTTEFKESENPIFGATVDNQKPGANTLTVTYNSTTNRPIVSTTDNRTATITLGQNFNTLTTSNTMKTSSALPTWETANGDYTPVFPREDVTTDMTLKVKYTLYNPHSGETMVITGTATVPGEYLQWKPNYKYSYIFKLTDDALTPITFDAVQVETADGNIEYITTVDNPSITTYQNGSDVTNKNEYAAGDIYVVVGDGTALTVGTNANLYTASGANYIGGITEASVANALKNGVKKDDTTPTTWTVTDASSNTLTISSATGLTAFTQIEANASPTGAVLTINGAKFTATAGNTYVFEYIHQAYKAATGTYVTGTTYYTDNTGTTPVDTTGFEEGDTDVSSYFVADNPAEKHYKIIKVVGN